MERIIKFFTQVEEEAGIASLSLFLYGEGSVKISFQGEERIVELKKEGVREDFFILTIKLWNGMNNPELYSISIDEREYFFGLRSFGLDSTRGFFLNGKRYSLDGKNSVVTDSISELDKCDREGKVAAFIFPSRHIPTQEEVAALSSHPSLFFWGYKVGGEKEDELRRFNSILYSLDKTRATIGIFDDALPSLPIFDVTLTSQLKTEKRSVIATPEGEGFKL